MGLKVYSEAVVSILLTIIVKFWTVRQFDWISVFPKPSDISIHPAVWCDQLINQRFSCICNDVGILRCSSAYENVLLLASCLHISVDNFCFHSMGCRS